MFVSGFETTKGPTEPNDCNLFPSFRRKIFLPIWEQTILTRTHTQPEVAQIFKATRGRWVAMIWSSTCWFSSGGVDNSREIGAWGSCPSLAFLDDIRITEGDGSGHSLGMSWSQEKLSLSTCGLQASAWCNAIHHPTQTQHHRFWSMIFSTQFQCWQRIYQDESLIFVAK